jgi:hypothetical protein
MAAELAEHARRELQATGHAERKRAFAAVAS